MKQDYNIIHSLDNRANNFALTAGVYFYISLSFCKFETHVKSLKYARSSPKCLHRRKNTTILLMEAPQRRAILLFNAPDENYHSTFEGKG